MFPARSSAAPAAFSIIIISSSCSSISIIISSSAASRVVAASAGRDFVIPDDVKEIAFPVLRHRMILEVEAEIDGIKPDDYLKKIIDEVEVPR